jgi:hypothetical protein
MSKDIEKIETENNLPAQTSQHNAFEAFGNQATQRNIIGQILKFAKGYWRAGMNSTEIEDGVQLIVDMRTLTVGYQKWMGDKPVDSHMGLVSENYQPPRRKEIGDMEKEEWEIDEVSGQPRDPWQMSNMLILREIGTSGDEQGLYTFTSSSRGGLSAIGMLSKAYGRKIRENDELLPVVELEGSSYPHSNKRYGIIDIPIFKLVGWGTCANIVEGADDFEMVEEVKETDKFGKGSTNKTLPPPKKVAAAAAKPAPKKAEVKGKKSARF